MLHQKNLLAAGLVFSLVSFGVEAALTVETINGQNLVYDSGNNTTWTQDANLLGTLEATYGYNTIVNAIIAATPVIHDSPNGNDNGGSGVYNLSAGDLVLMEKWTGLLQTLL